MRSDPGWYIVTQQRRSGLISVEGALEHPGNHRGFVESFAPSYGVIETLVTFHRIAEPRYTTSGSLQAIS
jgi:hypothetical protein